MIVSFIIGCEIAFWVFVLAGLACRYILRLRKTGALLLLCTPLVDLVLLVATVAHLRGGGEASTVHGLAAVYIGISVAFGHRMIHWADIRFAHHFAEGPAPEKPAKFGAEHARRERKGWYLHLFGWGIGCAILYGMILMVGDWSRTAALVNVIRYWSLILGADFLICFSYTFWPREDNSRGISNS